MSKKHKKRRRRVKKPYLGKNRHHLLFQGRNWNYGKAKILKKSFVYMLDVKIHDELHNAIISNIPKPSPEGISRIYKAFQNERDEIARLDIIGASEWLTEACDEEPYHTTMQLQTLFLQERLK